MYELNAPINEARMKAIATGHSQTLERWEDGPNGRRSSGQPLIDEATGAPVRIYDCLFDTGRDGRPELHGVRIVSHEAPELAPYTEVTFDDLSARVRPARNGAKGIEVSFSATAIRPAGSAALDSTRPGRKTSTDETAAA